MLENSCTNPMRTSSELKRDRFLSVPLIILQIIGNVNTESIILRTT
jgi:hypothetical protein